MKNLDIDTILISLVFVLVILALIRVVVQRYRRKHIILPSNVREVDAKSATVDSAEKDAKFGNSNNQNIDVVEKIQKVEGDKAVKLESKLATEETKETAQNEVKKEESGSDILKSVQVDEATKNEQIEGIESDLSSEAVEEKPMVAKEETIEIDYDKLASDPVSILSNVSLPTNYRVAAIREIAYQELKDAVPQLISALYDEDSSVALVASECLGSMGDPRAIEPLMEVIQKNDADIAKTVEEYIGGDLVVLENDNPCVQQTESVKKEDTSPYNFKEMVVFKPEQLPVDYFQPDGSPISRKELVLKGLRDPNEQMRQIAAKAAIGIEEDEEVVEPLSQTLGNSSEAEAVRAMAAEALGGINTPESVSALVNALKDENVAVRYAASAALSGHSETKVIEALIGATRDTDKYVRASAAYALGNVSDSMALKALIDCAEDEAEVVRFSAVKSIASYNFDDVLRLVDNNRAGLGTQKQIYAKIEILSQFKDERAVGILKKFLEDPDTEICYKATMALMGHENPELITELIEASRRLDAELYKMAKENLAPDVFADITKYNEVGKDLRKSLSESIKEDKTSSSSDLDGQTGLSEENQPVNTGTFEESIEKDVPLAKIEGLSPEFEEIRQKLLDNSAHTRGSAANLLGNYPNSPEAMMLLRFALKDENEFVRASVVSSLGKIANDEALELILSCEKDSSEEVRYVVVKALAEISGSTANEALKRMAQCDISIDVKRNARIALEKQG